MATLDGCYTSDGGLLDVIVIERFAKPSRVRDFAIALI
jgi:hypothetical protein